jgi:hypothetical protein
MKTRLLLSALCGAAWLALAPAAHAVSDPAGDFLPGYAGSHAGDLDVTSATVTYNAGTHLFDFSATLAAPVGTTAGTIYVWGIDRGAGTEKFNTGPAPIGAGVKFDTVVIFSLDGSARIGATTLANDVTWSGDTITGSVPDSLLPSMGFAFADYTWNLWPRDGNVPAGNAAISDFAPDASNAGVTAVPEPGSWALSAGGLLIVAAARRRKGR